MAGSYTFKLDSEVLIPATTIDDMMEKINDMVDLEELDADDIYRDNYMVEMPGFEVNATDFFTAAGYAAYETSMPVEGELRGIWFFTQNYNLELTMQDEDVRNAFIYVLENDSGYDPEDIQDLIDAANGVESVDEGAEDEDYE